MASVDEIIMDPIESVMDSMGLMQGDLAPAKRTIVGASIGAAAVFTIKPSISFNSDGSIRPWSMMSEEANATSVPWWVFTAFPAFVLGVLI